jgi:hypothetical protein
MITLRVFRAACFNITVEPGDCPVWIEMSGPQGTKDFLASVFN